MVIKICLAGVTGWTGNKVVEAIIQAKDLQLVSAVSRNAAGTKIGDIKISGSVEEALQTPVDVFVDYTSAAAVRAHVDSALAHKTSVIVGSSGLSAKDYEEIEKEALRQDVGVISCGNFAITAALAKHFALIAAKYLPHREIIDYAYEGKMDAPSGSARELAEALAKVKANELGLPLEKTVGEINARGAQIAGTPVHSIRLPSYTLGFETIFGLTNERISIRHDAGQGAEPYVAGTLLAIRKVQQFKGLIRGMDTLLFAESA
ncbi:MAG: 4-hydroxy-tetrahydrodipicolinate reductase [Candidatus Obscuribacterales bacterium]|nr:4-hydroxy-tetrahydrodipicolinate reductase [Candidatus Obscuribacterales bacterium]